MRRERLEGVLVDLYDVEGGEDRVPDVRRHGGQGWGQGILQTY